MPRTAETVRFHRTFDYWWGRQGDWVETANARRGGTSGVQLLPGREPGHPSIYCKRQTGHLYRDLSHPGGRPTILRELHAYRAISQLGIRVPRIVFGGARKRAGHWEALLVTEALDGFLSLDRWYAGSPDMPSRQAVMHALADCLVRLHRARWQHGCCYPKHIFVRVTAGTGTTPLAEVALLDLEKCRRRFTVTRASRHDVAQLARHWASMPVEDLALLQGCITRSFQHGNAPRHPLAWVLAARS